MCGLLFSCNGKNSNENSGNYSQNESYEENEQGLAFYLQDDGTYAVGAGTAFLLETINIPSTFKGKAVTSVIDRGFGYFNGDGEMYSKFKKVILPESIKRIGKFAFDNSTLEDISLPKSLIEIDEYALSYCNIKTINYAGNYSDFEQIKFGESWVSTHDGTRYKNADIKCADKELTFNNLFESIVCKTSYGYIDRYDYSIAQQPFKITIDNELILTKGNSSRYIYVYEYSKQCFNLLRCVERAKVVSSNSSVATPSGVLSDGSNGFYLEYFELGNAEIAITSGNLAKSFTVKVVDSIATSVANAYNEFTSIPQTENIQSNSGRLYEYYSITGYAYIYEYSGNTNIGIKDSLDSERYIYFGRASTYPTITNGDNIIVKGRLNYTYERNSVTDHFISFNEASVLTPNI